MVGDGGAHSRWTIRVVLWPSVHTAQHCPAAAQHAHVVSFQRLHKFVEKFKLPDGSDTKSQGCVRLRLCLPITNILYGLFNWWILL